MKGIEGSAKRAGSIYLRQINRGEECHYHVVKTVNTLKPHIDEVVLEGDVVAMIADGYKVEIQRAKV